MDTRYTLEFEKPLRELSRQLEELQRLSVENNVDVRSEIAAIETKISQTKKSIYSNLTNWQRVQLARHPRRPYFLDYVAELFTGFQELHGDRVFRDDPAIVGGLGFFKGQPIVAIGQQKGRNVKENIRRNFGMPNPEGYRKALRLMQLAARFQLPVLTFVDTPGAFPGIGSEERHVAEAIAVNLREMTLLPTPIISVILGEGGSGGALGIAVADRVLMMENAYYSVISPEGCAAILWKDRAEAPRAAEALRIGAPDLLRFGIIEEIVPEPFGGAHTDPSTTAKSLEAVLERHLNEVMALGNEERLAKRYERYRSLGVWTMAPEENIKVPSADDAAVIEGTTSGASASA